MIRKQATEVSAWVRRNSEALTGLTADTRQRLAELPDDFLDTLREARESLSVVDAYEAILRGVREAAVPAAIAARVAAVPKALAEMPQSVLDTLWRGDFGPNSLYKLIPRGVKMNAESVANFLKKRDLSHIRSVKNAPALKDDIANVVFERVTWNRARGARDMTRRELARVRLDNFAEGVVGASKATTKSAAKGAMIGALLELPVTTVEHFLLVRREHKTPAEAALNAAKDLGKSAAGGAAGAVIYAGIALTGVSVAPVATPLVIIGGVVYVWSATNRIWRAAQSVAPPASSLPEPPRGGPPVAPLSVVLSELEGDRSDR
ncbi:hypothetical protein [Candidatus Palauibacter sp.]|uniref:hypothetical protein n=1 Tax=Candidatus Palauibacter sp. TaxID=3101350 RepID=UPI003B02EBFC